MPGPRHFISVAPGPRHFILCAMSATATPRSGRPARMDAPDRNDLLLVVVRYAAAAAAAVWTMCSSMMMAVDGFSIACLRIEKRNRAETLREHREAFPMVCFLADESILHAAPAEPEADANREGDPPGPGGGQYESVRAA